MVSAILVRFIISDITPNSCRFEQAFSDVGARPWEANWIVTDTRSFGLGSVDFGLTHLTNVQGVVRMVPKWMPLGGAFWTIVTGVCFVLAGVAILARILDVVAARSLAMMLLVFSALAVLPLIPASPHNHIAWGANAYNLAAVEAVWIFADSLQDNRAGREAWRSYI
jgi:uncharacterized membrane protein